MNIIKGDPSDNIIIESAIAGKVHFIITGDKHLLGIRNFRGIDILTPRQFMKLIRF